MEWFPKETAPKTGEHILITGGSFGICGGKKQPRMDVVHFHVDGFYPSYGPEEISHFTHWAPLPEAP